MYAMNRSGMGGTVAQLTGAEMVAGLGYVYAIGQIQWYFPEEDIAKQYAQLLPYGPNR